MKAPSYAKYKDSGIEWLGEIPAHWEARRLKLIATINDEALGEDTDSEYEIAYVDIGNVDATRGILEKEPYLFSDAPSRARRIVRDGDVIVSTVRTYLRAIAPISDPEPNLVVSTGFAVIRPRSGLGTGYASYMLRAPYFVDRVVAESVGVSYPAINAWQLGTFGVAVPDEDEQQAIAEFLDRETAKIDGLVEKKERLIELLQEKRTALITHAVTKGLDPDIPIKDSGVQWLGEVPTHWAETRLGWSVHVSGGHTPDTGELRFWDGEIPWVTPKDMKRRVITDSLDHVSEAALSETGLRLLATGSVLIVVRGMILAHTFPVAVLRAPATINQDMKALLPANGLESDYLAYLLEGISEFILSLVEESAHGTRRLQTELWTHVQLFLPPAIEQASIAEHLDHETAKIDALIGKVGEAIERLKEYRTALISAAVTGKIDVREEAQ